MLLSAKFVFLYIGIDNRQLIDNRFFISKVLLYLFTIILWFFDTVVFKDVWKGIILLIIIIQKFITHTK